MLVEIKGSGILEISKKWPGHNLLLVLQDLQNVRNYKEK
jgi:hypothetical protein